MKAIILAAGTPRIYNWFPKDQLPKCLYHHKGEVILSRTVNALREGGIDDIRIVTGFKREEIEKFNEENNLGLEITFNPEWKADAIASLLTGLKGVDEDVIILMSDLDINASHIRSFLDASDPLVWLRAPISRGRRSLPKELRLFQWCIVKVTKEKLHIFNHAYKHADKFAEVHRRKKVQSQEGNRIYDAICGAFLHDGSIGEIVLNSPIIDIDYYKQTDEYKRKRR